MTELSAKSVSNPPCVFCGGVTVIVADQLQAQPPEYFVGCPRCSARGPAARSKELAREMYQPKEP